MSCSQSKSFLEFELSPDVLDFAKSTQALRVVNSLCLGPMIGNCHNSPEEYTAIAKILSVYPAENVLGAYVQFTCITMFACLNYKPLKSISEFRM